MQPVMTLSFNTPEDQNTKDGKNKKARAARYAGISRSLTSQEARYHNPEKLNKLRYKEDSQ